jgi:hypothetical protein
MDNLTTTQLRANVYNILDNVIETGKPVKVSRKGYIIKITVEESKSKISSLIRQQIIEGDPNDLIDLHVAEWNEEKNLKSI